MSIVTFNDEYKKLRLLGQGAFAAIWKVRHRKLGYIRAVKVSNEVIQDEQDKAYQTFLKECRVLLQIGNGTHPNIVHIYQPRLIENRAMVEMDYVEGCTLEQYVTQQRFIKIDEVMRFAHQIVGALAYCHVDIYQFLMTPEEDNLHSDPNDARQYIITPQKREALIHKYRVTHNDLHSNNIMRRDYDGTFILLDFGLSIQNGHSVKSSARYDGAVEYKAPEKWEDHEPMPQTDIYGIGVLLFQMLAGRVPFLYNQKNYSTEVQALYDLYHAHLEMLPPPIFPLRKAAFEATHPGETYIQDYPDQLEQIIYRCLEKDPKHRYADAKELLNELEPLIQQGGESSPPWPTKDGEESSKDWKWLKVFLVTMGILSVTFGILLLRQTSHEGISPTPSETEENSESIAYNGAGGNIVMNADDYRTGAEWGDVAAQCNLGICYKKGYGVQKDDTKAVTWYRKAAEKGYAEAQHNLALCYYNGEGVAQDKAEAIKWFRKAANQGLADSQLNLGICYSGGDGVPQDDIEAAKWFRKAAERSHPNAQFSLGVCYDFGKGVPEDDTEAVKWYRKAASQGHAKAQYNLGICYENGEGVEKDKNTALMWYRKSAEQGYDAAIFRLKYLNNK